MKYRVKEIDYAPVSYRVREIPALKSWVGEEDRGDGHIFRWKIVTVKNTEDEVREVMERHMRY